MTNKPLALITGAAQGIGYACAEALADNGAQIILCDIDEDGVQAAAERLGRGAVAFTCDMGDTDQIDALFNAIEADHGVVEILVNNAGIALPGDFHGCWRDRGRE